MAGVCLLQGQGFTGSIVRNKCRLFRQFGGYLQPSCSCGYCWDDYFDVNPGKYHAARLAFEQMGEDTVYKGQTIMLTRMLTDGDETKELDPQQLVWIEQQTGRFMKALTRRIRWDKKMEAKEEQAA
jgi:hypothetical protein